MTDAERTHPAVERVEAALLAAGVEPRVRWFETATPTAAAAAAGLGGEGGALAHSLVFTLDGERLGGRIGRADADTVKTATGQTIGGVAPVGHPAPLRTLVDVALAGYPEVWAAAGHAHTVFPTTFDELLHLTSGTPTPVVP